MNNKAVLPITGYFDRVSARPGERLAAKISVAKAGPYQADCIRILCADPNPEGPGLRYLRADFGVTANYMGRVQPIDLGSYALMPEDPAFSAPVLGFSALVSPGLLRPEAAVIASALDATGQGWSIDLSDSALTFRAGGTEARLAAQMRPQAWYHVWGGYDRKSGRVLVGWCGFPGGEAHTAENMGDIGGMPNSATLTLAARRTGALSEAHFNGRIEDPAIWRNLHEGVPPLAANAPASALTAWWDFSVGIETQSVVDRGPRGLAGRLINVPTRAVRGARWTGAAMDWARSPRDYAAIRFHEDDLYDCAWSTDFEISVPDAMPSGIYGLRLRVDDGEDILPFYVLPPLGKRRADLCFLASTFTHQAYINHARGNCDASMRTRMREWGAAPYNADDYPGYGRSTYNRHPDGSGISMSSRLRPSLTVRPGYLTFNDARGSGLRHFSADSHLVFWLTERGIPFDVVTDEDLDDEGPALIAGYKAVVTGSHPEYHTTGTLDALEGYTRSGGRLAYLGGNGFYWKIARSPTLPGMIELRRAEGGIRAWAAAPGEAHHQLDGGYGGLWRRNGRAPQRVGAVGFSSQGLFEGSYYQRTERSHAPDVAWIFAGVSETRLGDYGLSGGGAAGFELDRADAALGTPEGAAVLARSTGHGPSFVVVPEELLSHVNTVTGEPARDLIRAEIVWCDMPRGGAIFAVGSITFCGSLNHANGDNGVSRMLTNVLKRFLTPTSAG